MREQCPRVTETDSREWLRLPGLFRRWEFEQVISIGEDFRFEEAGKAEDGTRLYAIYHREHSEEERPQ
jgi:hypothetical protein